LCNIMYEKFINFYIQVTFTTKTERWHTPITSFAVKEWLELDFSWSKDSGLKVYINNVLVSTATNAVERLKEATDVTSGGMLFGKAMDLTGKENGKFLMEEVYFYKLTREELADKGILSASK
jgi:hypothetical protein